MQRVSVEFLNATQFRKALRQLGPRVANKAVSRALREGAKIIQAEAKALAPVDSGALRKSIKVRVGKVRGKHEKKIILTAGFGAEWYAWLVEFGHRVGKASRSDRGIIEARSRTKDQTKKKALTAALDRTSTRKEIPAQPFMRPAFDNKKAQAARAIESSLSQSIQQEWANLAP